ncbi:MAG: CarD family transcriptional regulator [Oscillospiraceae bacterium]|nr:CarD family transcriptional regulator [Oscillospiraceae bacterium]
MFQQGELILYGNTGVCRIEAIGPRQGAVNVPLAERNKEYYTLSPLFGDGVIYAPLDTTVFMRPILTKEQAMELIHRIPQIQAEPFATRDQRMLSEHYRGFFEKHNCEDLLQLICNIYVKGQNLAQCGKKVGSTDQQYLRRATSLLHGELAAALGISIDEVEDFIAKEMEQK